MTNEKAKKTQGMDKKEPTGNQQEPDTAAQQAIAVFTAILEEVKKQAQAARPPVLGPEAATAVEEFKKIKEALAVPTFEEPLKPEKTWELPELNERSSHS